ncbi:hypothetical protein BC938DRAFT_481472, partial [Jimgerdemannia flammicorona]
VSSKSGQQESEHVIALFRPIKDFAPNIFFRVFFSPFYVTWWWTNDTQATKKRFERPSLNPLHSPKTGAGSTEFGTGGTRDWHIIRERKKVDAGTDTDDDLNVV